MISVRRASPGEEPLIENILRRSLLASYARFLPAESFKRLMDMDRPGVVARENGPDFLIAEIDGAPAGVLLLKGDYVDHLWTDPDHMGRGAGSTLLARAGELAAEDGHRHLTLNCLDRNEPALAFYRARGFTDERVYTATDHFRGERVHFMVKPLP